MKLACQACGVEKDMDVPVRYLADHAERDGISDTPTSPLFELDCQGDAIPNHPQGYCDYRRVRVCHECFHKLSPDMWISRECWEKLAPIIPFDDLERLT